MSEYMPTNTALRITVCDRTSRVGSVAKLSIRLSDNSTWLLPIRAGADWRTGHMVKVEKTATAYTLCNLSNHCEYNARFIEFLD